MIAMASAGLDKTLTLDHESLAFPSLPFPSLFAVLMRLAVVLWFSFNISEFKDPGEKSGKWWGTFF